MPKSEEAQSDVPTRDPLNVQTNYTLSITVRKLEEVRQISDTTGESIQSLFKEGIDMMLEKRNRSRKKPGISKRVP